MSRKLPRPTDGELAILEVLWARGPSTVREVHQGLGNDARGYTTTLKLMQIMAEKGLVGRDESRRSHVYRAELERDAAQGQLVGDLIRKAFSGSARSLVLRALSDEDVTSDDLDAIRRMLDELEGAP